MFKKFLAAIFVISFCLSLIISGQKISFALTAGEVAEEVYKERKFDDSKTILGVNNNISLSFNNAAEASVVESIAFGREIIRRPESVLDLTCFSKTFLANFANVGKIFSDLRFAPTIGLKGNPFCSAVKFIIDLGQSGSLWMDLLNFFKVPGLNIPPLELCGPKVDIQSELTGALTAAIKANFGGGGTSGALLKAGKSPFACLFNTNLQIKGNFEFMSPCITVKIPSASCGSLTRLAKTSIMNKIGGIVPLNKPFNKGGLYTSMDEKGKVSLGFADDFEDTVRITKMKEKAAEASEYLNNYNFGGMGVKFEGGYSKEGGAFKRNTSTDGVTSDGGANTEKGSMLTSGDGTEFKDVLKNKGKPIFDAIMKDAEALQGGPGKFRGWNPKPVTFDGIDLKDVFKSIKENVLEDNDKRTEGANK